MDYSFNKYQTPLTQEFLDSLPRWVRSELVETIESIKFIQWLVSPEKVRGFAKDRPRDDSGRIIVDITKPHILENMDFFRERAIFFDKHGVYTDITPNPNPKSAYAEFWREEIKKWKEGVVRESDGEWIPGNYYFYLNYSPIWINEVVDKNNTSKLKVRGERKRQFPAVWLGDYLWYHYRYQARENGSHCKLLKARGKGFEQPNSETVVTPNGFKKVGDVIKGDYLIGIDGKPTKVLEVYEQGLKDVYSVTLMDGRTVKCGLDHLWYVMDYAKKRLNVVPLHEMIEKGLYWKVNNGVNNMYKYKIPEYPPIEYDEKELPVPPYTLGVLLGDGAFVKGSVRIATIDKEIIDNVLLDLNDEYIAVKDTTNCNHRIVYKYEHKVLEKNSKYKNYQYGINPLKRELTLNGWNVKGSAKRIPDIYKFSSIQQRLELLKGLMDTDGSINSTGNLEFSNSNYDLISDVASLCRSLGIKATIGLGRAPRKKNILGRMCNIKQEYRLYLSTNIPIFKLTRKLNRCRIKETFKEYSIVDIKKLDYKEESRCFLVDNNTHTYLTGDYVPTHNSYKMGSDGPHVMYTEPGIPFFYLASDKTFLEGDKGVFGKAVSVLDWIGKNTPLPRMRIIDKPLEKKLGFKDEYGIEIGLQSSMFGISLKDDPDKARGVRGYMDYEEDGVFPNLESAWNINREGVEDGGIVFAQMVAGGTGGTDNADFTGSEKLFYNPEGFNIYGIPNVFDKNTNGTTKCGFFWGAYLNRSRCYDKSTGEPDVIKALVEVLSERDIIKNSSPDTRALTQKKAEQPLTPQDAVMRIEGSIFPTGDLKEYLADISPNLQNFVSSHYIGDIVYNPQGEYIFKYTDNKTPVREFPIENNINKEGCIEIFELPQRDGEGKISPLRYIFGIDPVDDDSSSTNSLPSIIGFDRFTDRIVCEYTGRPKTAVEFYELCIRLIEFYNGTANYENDKKGLFSYFSNKHKLGLLCETPKILKDKQLVKDTALFGNKAVGTNSSKMVNAWGRRLQADWLVQPAYGEEETGKLNMHKIRSIGYLKELIAWNPDINADRVSAMGMLMIYREDLAKFEIRQFSKKVQTKARDKFFSRNEKFPNFGYSMT